jgi:hypothetical protein
MPIDLNEEIRSSINGAALRGSTLALAFVRPDGSPSVTFRGSAYVYDDETLAIWVRKRNEGFAKAIDSNPRVSLAFFEPDGPGARFLSIEGRARVASELDDEVYGSIIEGEQKQDPDRAGVAVLIDVDSLTGMGADGVFQQSREVA